MRFPSVRALIKGHFFAGLLVVIPVGVIVWIVTSALQALWTLHDVLPESMQPSAYLSNPNAIDALNGLMALAAALVLLLSISVLGWFSKQYLGTKALELFAELINRIPVIRSVYSALDQLLRAFTSGKGGQQFSRVVYIEYPRKGIWALAFVTGAARGPAVPEKHLNVFIPTTPNPTSGFHLIVAESEVRDTQMRVEEAFKVLLSLGIAQPGGPGSRHG